MTIYKTVDIFDDIPGIKHGFFTRQGGVSTGHFASLNFKSGNGEKEENIKRNKEILAQSLNIDPSKMRSLHQVYGADVITVNEKSDFTTKPQGDSIVTNTIGMTIGTKTADCAPVLLACAKTKVIAAVHGMWGCTYKGIVEKTLQSMIKLGADRSSIRAAIGPCIQQSSYEVDNPEYSDEPEWFYKKLLNQSPENTDLFLPPEPNGKRFFDLRGYVEKRLKNAGIHKIAHCKIDTYSNPDMFFSMRRNLHAGNKIYGTQLSVIVRTE